MERLIALSSGTAMPVVGFGTWRISDDAAGEVVSKALKTGYRHIDTAKLYANERGVGKAIRDSGVARENIFVTTKLWSDDQPYDRALQAFDASLDRLGLDYVDLYLIHWPTEDRDDAWKALQEIHKSGKAKAIGVSNYSVRDLKELLDWADVAPAVNQVEFHPFNYKEQRELLEYCEEQDIAVTAYSPLKRHSQLDTPELEKIANEAGKTSSQVVLRWCLQHGTAPLPRSTNVQHIRENMDLFDFELSADQMRTIDSLSS
jgi:diketogulonate reductase-like aldo/keto reductase